MAKSKLKQVYSHEIDDLNEYESRYDDIVDANIVNRVNRPSKKERIKKKQTKIKHDNY